MHKKVSFNFSVLDNDAASLPALSPAAIYGKGIFTTLAIHDRTPFVWDKHWRRLTHDSARLGIDISEFSETATRDALIELIGENELADGRARITFSDETASEIWSYDSNRRSSLLITTADFRPLPQEFRLTTSPYRINSVSPLAGVKSCNYVEKLLALTDAKQQGFEECIQVNERGEISTGAMANLFWLKGGRLFTPSTKTGCLAGTTREVVLENLECKEVEAELDELESAEQIFLTSAGLGVVRAATYEGRPLSRDEHPIMSIPPQRV